MRKVNTTAFQNQIEQWAVSNGYECRQESIQESPFAILHIASVLGKQVKLHLVDLQTWLKMANQLPSSFFTDIVTTYRQATVPFVNLWEDVWRSRPKQVQERLSSIMGANATLPGRLTESRVIDKPLAQTFMEQWHVNGVVNSVYQIGLFLPARRWHYLSEKIQRQFTTPQELLIAVATFGRLRKMNHLAEGYISGEMVRLATFGGITITGGLSKLLKKFQTEHTTNDIMTYADRDWSDGDSYAQTGFEFIEDKEAFEFLINRSTFQRTKSEQTNEVSNEFLIGRNAGSRKWVKYYTKAVDNG